MTRVLAIAAAIAVGVLARAEATPIVSISPATQNANVGDPVNIDIIVTGLTEPVGGFSFDLGFDDTIITGNGSGPGPGTGYTIGAGLGAAPLDLSFGFGAAGTSPLNLFVAADATLNAAGLAALQGTGFTLATINFTAIAPGLSPLTLSNVVLSNADGSATLSSQFTNGDVCVGAPAGVPCARQVEPVPEPTSMLLLGTGVATLVARRRTKNRR